MVKEMRASQIFIIIAISALVLFISGINGCEPLVKVSCTDSDITAEISEQYVKGTVTIGSSQSSDFCLSDTQLLEYYCAGNSLSTKVYDCPYGCQDGACIKAEEAAPPTCTDSDGEVDPYIKGSCTDSRGVTVSDNCLNADGSDIVEGAYVKEAFCLTNEMREYCKRYNSAEYCDNLANDCYYALMIPQEGLAWTYFEKDSKYFCPYGCQDGACLACTDSDGGIDYYTVGRLDVFDSNDYCSLDNVLVEKFCRSDIMTLPSGAWCTPEESCYVEYTCPYGCQDGACVSTLRGGVWADSSNLFYRAYIPAGRIFSLGMNLGLGNGATFRYSIWGDKNGKPDTGNEIGFSELLQMPSYDLYYWIKSVNISTGVITSSGLQPVYINSPGYYWISILKETDGTKALNIEITNDNNDNNSNTYVTDPYGNIVNKDWDFVYDIAMD